MLTLQIFTLILAGLLMLVLAIRQWQLRTRILGWQLTEAIIVQSQVVDSGEGLEPLVSYRYSVRGHDYTGDALFPGGIGVSAGRRWAGNIVLGFPLGSRTWILVDPDEPSESTLGMPLPAWAHLMLWAFAIGSFSAALALARYG